MSEEPQKSRIDTLMGIFKALLKFDPIVALIAILIIAPVAIPIVQAILSGNTVVVITFTVFIGVFTMLVYIPLIIVKTRQETERELAETRQKAVETEAKTRIIIAESKQEQLTKVVSAQISTLTAERDFILGKSILEDRAIFKKSMEELHEILKNGEVNFVSQLAFTETIQKVLEDLSVVYQKLDEIEGSPVDGPKITNNLVSTSEPSYPTTEIQDLENKIEKLENTNMKLEDQRDRYNQELLPTKSKLYETEAHLAEVRDLINQYREAYGELPEPKEWAKPSQDLTIGIKEGLPKTLPEPAGYDAFSERIEKTDNFIISTVKKVIDKVTPDKSVLTDAMDVLDNLKDETEDEPRVFPPDPTTSSFREIQRGAEAPKLVPKFWTCQCGKNNNMKKVRCPGCGKSRAAQTVV